MAETKKALIRTVRLGRGHRVELDLFGDEEPARTRCIGADETASAAHLIERAASAALILAGYAVSTKRSGA